MPGIPLASPLYPDPPYDYRGSVMLTALLDAPSPWALPAGLDAPDAPLTAIVFATYPDTTIGPYHEVVVVTACSFEGAPGLYCPFIYVDTDDAMCAGREIWGFPKKLAEITLSVSGETVRGELSRRGEALAVVEGATPEALDPAAAAALGALPIFNHKRIPGAAAKEPDVDALTRVVLEIAALEASAGAGTAAGHGELAGLLGAGGAQLVRSVVDSVLPAGERVA